MSEPLRWVSLKTDFFDSESAKLVAKLPEGDMILLLWLRLLLLAGRSNDAGRLTFNNVRPYTVQMLSAIFDRSEGMIRLALDALKGCGVIVEDGDGTMRIADWDTTQHVRGIEKVNRLAEQNRERVRRFRERQSRPALTDGGGQPPPPPSESAANQGNIGDAAYRAAVKSAELRGLTWEQWQIARREWEAFADASKLCSAEFGEWVARRADLNAPVKVAGAFVANAMGVYLFKSKRRAERLEAERMEEEDPYGGRGRPPG